MGDGSAQLLWEKFPLKRGDASSKLHWIPNPDAVDTYALSEVDIDTLRRVCPDRSPSRPDWLWIKSQLIFRGGQTTESVKQLSAELILEFLKRLPDPEPTRGYVKLRTMLVPPKRWDEARPVEPSAIVMDTIGLAWSLHYLQAAFEKPRYTKHVCHTFGIFANRRWWLALQISMPRTPLRVALRQLHTTQPHWNGGSCSSFTEATWDLALTVFDTLANRVQNSPAGRECSWDDPFEADEFHRQGVAVNDAFHSYGLKWPPGQLDILSLVSGVEWEWAKLMPPAPVAAGTTTLEPPKAMRELRDCDTKAGRQYDEAMKHADGMGLELKTYEAAYYHYCEHLKDTGERMTPLDSWKNFASKYLKAEGRPKYTKGAGVETRSVVRSKSKNRTKTDRL